MRSRERSWISGAKGEMKFVLTVRRRALMIREMLEGQSARIWSSASATVIQRLVGWYV